MREIKFRGRSVTTGKWFYGDLVQGTSSDEKYILPFTDNLKELITVDPATVGQFVWKHDRDGVEIYEGDWTESTWGYSGLVDIEGIMYAMVEGTISDDIIVCSNIHDTPEPWKEESDV